MKKKLIKNILISMKNIKDSLYAVQYEIPITIIADFERHECLIRKLVKGDIKNNLESFIEESVMANSTLTYEELLEKSLKKFKTHETFVYLNLRNLCNSLVKNNVIHKHKFGNKVKYWNGNILELSE